MPSPAQFCNGTAGAGVSSATVSVTAATGGGDALAVIVSMGGSGSPTVTSVTDTKSNTYTLVASYTTAAPFLYLYAATGATAALTTSDTVTAHFSGSTSSGAGIIGADCPGVATVDVNATPASGTSTAPSVSGTPAASGETAIAAFTWSNPGGSGTVGSPFTQLGQNHITSNIYTTCSYDTSPPSGSPLTASYAISSTTWRAILVTFKPSAPPSPFTPPPRPAKGAQAAVRGSGKGARGAPRVFVPVTPSVFTLPSRPSRGAQAAARGAGKGAQGAPAVAIPPPAVNQWAATFSQPSSFGTTPPALQSVVVPLTPASSVGGGTGIVTPGNWLFCITGSNQDTPLPAVTWGCADDIHSWWRPLAPSGAGGNTRCGIWYTPNLARQAGAVYVAPSGAASSFSVLVVEIAGIGPWDTVTGFYGAFANAATALSLSLPAPGPASFVIAGVCGDLTTAGQSFAPAGWHPLTAVTASNGTDHSCDAVLTAATLASTASPVSVTASSSSPCDLSGFILAVQIGAASPIPSVPGVSPGWAGRMILEFAPGGGFGTPPDQLNWVALSDSAAAPGTVKRFWGWADNSGVPYRLGQLQSGTGSVQLDNSTGPSGGGGGDLTPSNPASPFYPDVTTGTPLRLRAALGTLRDGTVVNRWYVIQRNALDWTEKRTGTLRNWVEAGLTDIWSAVAASCPSPYRGEIGQEASLYAWWPMDDQPQAGGVQPTSLVNAAPGNTNVLNITASPGGVTGGHQYTTAGVDATSDADPAPPSVAVYTCGALQGWMYGDPPSSPQSSAAGNPVTASPGSAAWQQAGMLGSTGANGWFLAVNDPAFPPLSSGVTVKGWFNAAFFGTATASTAADLSGDNLAGQPYAPITLCTLSTSAAPVAVLQLDRATGHLNLITYNGATGTSSSVYAGSDLRSQSWHCVDIQLTTTTWAVLVDGDLLASASGTATGMSNFTWLTLNGDYGTNGGASPSSIQHGGNVAYSHWAVFGAYLPAWRLTAHYCAAITGFGLLPAPQSLALSTVTSTDTGGTATSYTPDGTLFDGSYGISGNVFTFTAKTVAVAGTATSGPSAEAATAGIIDPSSGDGCAVWASWSALAPKVQVYTAAAANAETLASAAAGSGDSFSSGYGSGASGHGVCHVSGGTGAAPPSGPSQLGDIVAQRIERILGYGGVTYPGRAIDETLATLPVQAALDVGGQQAGANIQNQVYSDNGLLNVDNCGVLCYRARPRLASDTVIWNLSSAGPAYGLPFAPDQAFGNDPQRVWNTIQVAPYSPDGATPPLITPSSASAVAVSQQQYGNRPLPWSVSYLQSAAAIQAQVNWLIAQFGSLRRRVTSLKADAASHPAAWLFVLGANPGDLAQVTDQPMQGGPLSVGTYRISSISRRITFGANKTSPEASLTIVADPEPAWYWTNPPAGGGGGGGGGPGSPVTDEAAAAITDEAGSTILSEG